METQVFWVLVGPQVLTVVIRSACNRTYSLIRANTNESLGYYFKFNYNTALFVF
jgi:hypothetical protein